MATRKQASHGSAALAPLLGLLTATMVFAVTPAGAQQRAQDCVVDPQSGDAEPAAPRDGESAEALADCGGVLKPAPVGDPELVEPAPDAGKTPVIEPEDLPDQPSDDAPSGTAGD